MEILSFLIPKNLKYSIGGKNLEFSPDQMHIIRRVLQSTNKSNYNNRCLEIVLRVSTIPTRLVELISQKIEKTREKTRNHGPRQ